MIQQGVYRHYRGGLYTVLMAARCSDNGPNEGQNVVIYVSHTTGEVRTRMEKEFFETIVPEGTFPAVHRFTFIAHSMSK